MAQPARGEGEVQVAHVPAVVQQGEREVVVRVVGTSVPSQVDLRAPKLPRARDRLAVVPMEQREGRLLGAEVADASGRVPVHGAHERDRVVDTDAPSLVRHGLVRRRHTATLFPHDVEVHPGRRRAAARERHRVEVRTEVILERATTASSLEESCSLQRRHAWGHPIHAVHAARARARVGYSARKATARRSRQSRKDGQREG